MGCAPVHDRITVTSQVGRAILLRRDIVLRAVQWRNRVGTYKGLQSEEGKFLMTNFSGADDMALTDPTTRSVELRTNGTRVLSQRVLILRNQHIQSTGERPREDTKNYAASAQVGAEAKIIKRKIKHTHSQPVGQVACSDNWAHTPETRGPTADRAKSVAAVVAHSRFEFMTERC